MSETNVKRQAHPSKDALLFVAYCDTMAIHGI